VGAVEVVYTLRRSLVFFAPFAGLLPCTLVLCNILTESTDVPDGALLLLIPIGYFSLVSLALFWLGTLRIELCTQGLLCRQRLRARRLIRWEEVRLIARYQGCWGWPQVRCYARGGQRLCFLEPDPAEPFYHTLEAKGAQYHFHVLTRT
jgi:hypothetical protein